MAKLYTFNRPVFALVLLPMALFLVMLVSGLFQEVEAFAMVMVVLVVLITLLFMGLIISMSFLRRVKIDPQKAEWITLKTKRELPFSEIKHFGVIKYRSFRFIFLSRSDELPFKKHGSKVVPDEDNFLLQYRKGAWKTIREFIRSQHPDLKPENFTHT